MKKVVSVLLMLCLVCGVQAQKKKNNLEKPEIPGMQRIEQVLEMISDHYVEDPNTDQLSEAAVNEMLKTLDPHSVYIPAKEVARTNEGLLGSFEGVGISFTIHHDTIQVADVIAGGPAEKVGMMTGDKILRIDGQPATGDSVNNQYVTNHLRGKKGTKVVVTVQRQHREVEMHIVRDKVPIYSVDTYFMVNDTVGYIRLIRFSRNSVNEFRQAMTALKKQGMKAIMLDLRGNAGGYLDIASGLANEFLENKRLIVYTEGRKMKRQNFVTNGRGSFKAGRLVVLIDEHSASASEIVSGAIQDWDRGTLVGRRSFGKGLVQHMYELKDGGQIRLTTARYYTPSGRCIQKPYEEGTDAYRRDLNERYKNGELVNADSVHFSDSLKYKTAGGRTVYGGGGIMPDVFVPMDTMRLSNYYIDLRGKGLLTDYTLTWADAHREELADKGFDNFLQVYDSYGVDSTFAAFAIEQGVVRDVEAEAKEPERTQHSDVYLSTVLKSYIAKNLFGNEYYYRIMCSFDECFKRALLEF